MTQIATSIQIARPRDEVFAFVTTPGNWPKWHPSSLGVSGATDHPLTLGEEVTEEFVVAGRRGRTVWTVRDCRPPCFWVIQSAATARGKAQITYTLTQQDGYTYFHRELVYTLRSPQHALLNWLLLKFRVRAESREALRRLKQRLEARAGMEEPAGSRPCDA
jgi:uncharacterized protein YndB with AHSA1/START domain